MLYLDMDHFFAACEEVRHPEFKGKPLVVGSAPKESMMKGVVQTCNREARKFGVHSAMPTRDAYKLNPKLEYIQADWDYYENVSNRIMEFLSSYKLKMEVDSIDEAVMEIDVNDYKEAMKLGEEIKKNIKEKLGLPCTIGVSKGKIFAKMVCDAAKPDGLKAVEEEKIQEFLNDKPVEKIPGIGPKTRDKLNSIKIKTIEELAKTDPMVLIDMLGSFGKELFTLANGKDNSVIVENSNIVSISRERTLERNTDKIDDINKMIEKLAKEVIEDVKKRNVVFKTIGVKARYFDFTDKIKSRTFSNYSGSEELVLKTASSLIKDLVNEKPVRKVGVRVSSLVNRGGQRSLS